MPCSIIDQPSENTKKNLLIHMILVCHRAFATLVWTLIQSALIFVLWGVKTMSAFLRVLTANGIVFKHLATVVATVGIFCSLNSEVRAESGLEYDDVELVSSVMWQPLQNGKKYLYPPGIPAVLKKTDESRMFKVEQYYNTYLGQSRVKPRVRGTWPKTPEFELKYNELFGFWSNRYVRVTNPSCDREITEYGYRCIIEFKFTGDVPTGTVGISIGTMVEDIEFTHPNAVFWILLPDQYTPPARAESVTPPPSAMRDYDGEVDHARKHVVRISLGGSFSLGSGFLTRDVEPLRKLFQPQVFQAIAMSDESDIFVVTAAHLFPVAYSYQTLTDPFVLPINTGAPFRSGYTYDLQVDGKIIPARKEQDMVHEESRRDREMIDQLAAECETLLARVVDNFGLNMPVAGLLVARDMRVQSPSRRQVVTQARNEGLDPTVEFQSVEDECFKILNAMPKKVIGRELGRKTPHEAMALFRECSERVRSHLLDSLGEPMRSVFSQMISVSSPQDQTDVLTVIDTASSEKLEEFVNDLRYQAQISFSNPEKL